MEIIVDKKLFWFWFWWLAAGVALAALLGRPLFASFWGSLAGIFLFGMIFSLPLAAFCENIFAKFRLGEGKKPLVIISMFALAFFIFYAAFSVHKYDNFAAGYDLAIFDQAIWHMSRFELPASSVRNVALVFADHFDPAIALLVPFYGLLPDPRTLLVLQSLVLVAPVFALYAWGRRAGINPLHLIFLALYYLTAASVQGTPNFDFHETALAPLLITLSFWFLREKKWRLFFLVAALLVLVKEEFALLVAMMGIYIIIKEKNRRTGIAAVALGLGFFVLLMAIIMPAINGAGSGYVYGQLFYGFENGFLAGIVNYVFNPAGIMEVLAVFPDKWWNIIFYMLPLAAPLFFVPQAIVLFLPALAQRVLSSYEYLSWPRYYYNLSFAALGLAVFAVFLAEKKYITRLAGVENKLRRYSATAVGWLVAFPLAVNLVYSGNYSYLFDPAANWNSVVDPDPAATKALMQAIPPEASVAASQVFLPHLSHRQNLYALPRMGDAQFVAVRACAAEPCNYWPMNKNDVPVLVARLKNDPAYSIKLENAAGIVFEKTGEYDTRLQNENRQMCRQMIENAKLEPMHQNYMQKNCGQ